MNHQEFIRRSAGLAGNAYMSSFTEMMHQRQDQPYIARLAKTSVGKVARQVIPDSLKIDGEQHRLFSAGGQQIVYGSENSVAKIVTRSLSFDRDRTMTDVDFYQRNYDTAAPSMGEHLTPTEFGIKRFRSGLFAAIAIQPRIKPEKQFLDVEEMVYFRDDPPYMQELQSLIDSLYELYETTQMQLDLNGANNLLLSDQDSPRIQIVDSIVVAPPMQATIDRIRQIPVGETIVQRMSLLRDAVALRPIEPAASHSALAR